MAGYVKDKIMKMNRFAAAGLVAAAMLFTAPVLLADDTHTHADASVMAGSLTLTGAFTRATLPAARVGGGFLSITNHGDESDRLVSATSPATPMVQLHEMRMDGDVMKMRQMKDGIEIPAGETVTLAPGGLHLMFMKMTTPFVEGEEVPVTLGFEKAGTVDIMLQVGGMAARTPHENMDAGK